jgi:hypothetical protein
MQDRDNSKDDIHLIPSLRISPVPPSLDSGLAEKYGITIEGGDAFIPLVPVTDNGTGVALPAMVSSAAASLPLTTSLVWQLIAKLTRKVPRLNHRLASYNERFILTD